MNFKWIAKGSLLLALVAGCALALFSQASTAVQSSLTANTPSASADEFVGLWKAKRRYGP